MMFLNHICWIGFLNRTTTCTTNPVAQSHKYIFFIFVLKNFLILCSPVDLADELLDL